MCSWLVSIEAELSLYSNIGLKSEEELYIILPNGNWHSTNINDMHTGRHAACVAWGRGIVSVCMENILL
jgi:hypothetical protein